MQTSLAYRPSHSALPPTPQWRQPSVSGTTRIVLANFANIGPGPPIEAAATVMDWGPFRLNSGALSDATFVFWEGTGLVTADLRSYGFIVATAGTVESIQSSLSAFAVGSVLSLPYMGACIGDGFLAEASGMVSYDGFI